MLANKSYPTVGILPLVFDLYKKPQKHGYTIIKVDGDNPYYDVGSEIRGYKFHYPRGQIRMVRKAIWSFACNRGPASSKIVMEFSIKMFWLLIPIYIRLSLPDG